MDEWYGGGGFGARSTDFISLFHLIIKQCSTHGPDVLPNAIV
jgi:hypothetical protein